VRLQSLCTPSYTLTFNGCLGFDLSVISANRVCLLISLSHCDKIDGGVTIRVARLRIRFSESACFAVTQVGQRFALHILRGARFL